MNIKKLLILLVAFALAAACAQAQYTLKRGVVGNGSTSAQNTMYKLSGTLGQPVVGVSSSTVNTAKHGFWYTVGGGTILAIDLNDGWNMISTNVSPASLSIASIMNQLGSDLVLVRDNDGNLYVPSEAVNTINNIDIAKGYQVFVRGAHTLNVIGREVDLATTPVALGQNWNIISYLPQHPQPAETAISTLNPEMVIAKNGNGQFYMPAFSINTFENGTAEAGMMVPGKGYQIFMTEAKSFNYAPTIPGRIAEFSGSSEPICSYYTEQIPATNGNASLVIVSDNCPELTEISVTLRNGTAVGHGVFHNGRAAVTLAARDQFHKEFTNDGDELQFVAYNPKTQKITEMQVVSATNVITGKYDNVLRFAPNGVFVVKAKAEGIENSAMELECYPNPVSAASTVEFVCPDGGATEIALYSLNGEKVFTVFSGDTQIGSRNVAELIPGQLPSGVYSLVLRSASGTVAKQISIVK